LSSPWRGKRRVVEWRKPVPMDQFQPSTNTDKLSDVQWQAGSWPGGPPRKEGAEAPSGAGSVTKRLLSSTASKAYGSASCHGMDCALSISASALGGQCSLSFFCVWHC